MQRAPLRLTGPWQTTASHLVAAAHRAVSMFQQLTRCTPSRSPLCACIAGNQWRGMHPDRGCRRQADCSGHQSAAWERFHGRSDIFTHSGLIGSQWLGVVRLKVIIHLESAACFGLQAIERHSTEISYAELLESMHESIAALQSSRRDRFFAKLLGRNYHRSLRKQRPSLRSTHQFDLSEQLRI